MRTEVNVKPSQTKNMSMSNGGFKLMVVLHTNRQNIRNESIDLSTNDKKWNERAKEIKKMGKEI